VDYGEKKHRDDLCEPIFLGKVLKPELTHLSMVGQATTVVPRGMPRGTTHPGRGDCLAFHRGLSITRGVLGRYHPLSESLDWEAASVAISSRKFLEQREQHFSRKLLWSERTCHCWRRRIRSGTSGDFLRCYSSTRSLGLKPPAIYACLELACLGNPDPVGVKVYCPTGNATFDNEATEEAPPG